MEFEVRDDYIIKNDFVSATHFLALSPAGFYPSVVLYSEFVGSRDNNMTLFDAQSDEWARGGFQQMASFMRALRKENADNELASRQLQRELEQQVKLENAKPDGVLQSLLYTKLPRK